MSKQIKKNWGKGAILLTTLITIVVLSGCSNSASTTKTSKKSITQTGVAKNTGAVKNTGVAKKRPAGTDTDKDGIPDNAEVVLGTDPKNPDTDGDGMNDKEDKNPTLVDKSFIKSTGVNDFSIEKVLVENNVDPVTNKSVIDHLEVFLKNKGQKAIKDLSIYYEYNDLVDKSKQSYEMPLNGFVLNPGETKSVHIDISGKPGHFRANPSSSYYQSINPKEVKIIVSATGHQAQEASVKKDKGGAETAD